MNKVKILTTINLIMGIVSAISAFIAEHQE